MRYGLKCTWKTANVGPSVSIVVTVVRTCNIKDVIVDWSSGYVQSNVGDVSMNIETGRKKVGNSDKARQDAVDIVSKLCVVPPCLTPPTPRIVLRTEIVSLTSVEDRL